METKYPECDKLAAVELQSRTIRDFLAWLRRTKEVSLCNLVDGEDEMEYEPIYIGTEQLLAEYFHVNLNKVEKERRQMLDELRRKQ